MKRKKVLGLDSNEIDFIKENSMSTIYIARKIFYPSIAIAFFMVILILTFNSWYLFIDFQYVNWISEVNQNEMR